MNESTIRSRLRAAIGESSYPPALTGQIAARLGRPVSERERQGRLLVLIAALLAVAIVAGLIFTGQALRHKVSLIPAAPSPSPVSPGAGCAQSSQVRTPFGAPNVVEMGDRLNGWATGGLRTTDGGATWRDVTPKDLRAGESADMLANGLYPAGYADFYLDPDHAWLMRTATSNPAVCADRVVISSTGDGGKTWRETRLPLALAAETDAQIQYPFFLDARHGWLQVVTGAGLSGLEGHVTGDELYATSDGGATWQAVADLTRAGRCAAGGEMAFLSPSIGWMYSGCQTDVELLVTHDGGVTWSPQTIFASASFGCVCFTQTPTFVSATDGFVVAQDSSIGPGNTHVFATSDGGASWRELPKLPGKGYVFTVDFADRNSFWMLESEPGADKGNPGHDWLYHSTDGGQTWLVVSTQTPMLFWINYFVFFDAQHGFVEQANVGPPPDAPTRIETTNDGGLTWTEIIPVVK